MPLQFLDECKCFVRCSYTLIRMLMCMLTCMLLCMLTCVFVLVYSMRTIIRMETMKHIK